MNSKPISPLVALAALGCIVLPVQATPSFLEIDKDKNGFISASESIAVPGLSEQMIVLDENSDGLLSPAEFAALKTPSIQIPTEEGSQ